MIKFFRNIRRRLLSENKLSRYFLYAIGEIFLVVIGILIALQINNWNEAKKTKLQEVKLLNNLYASIQGDLIYINDYSSVFDQADRSIYAILKHMEDDLPYSDSLDFHFKFSTVKWPPKFNRGVFESLSSSDINTISNDSLKNNIIKYYYDAEEAIAGMDLYAEVVEDASKNIFNTRFTALWNNAWEDPHYGLDEARNMKPINYDKLKNDREYLYFLQSQKNKLYFYVRRNLLEAKLNSENLIKQFETELEVIEK